MRIESAAISKGRYRDGVTHFAPRPGTRLRRLYNFLMANKGNVLYDLNKFEGVHIGNNQITQLRDFYGLDIRRLEKNAWVFAGEWFGGTYADYVADQLTTSLDSE